MRFCACEFFSVYLESRWPSANSHLNCNTHYRGAEGAICSLFSVAIPVRIWPYFISTLIMFGISKNTKWHKYRKELD